jgi:hypothetical protein
MDEVLPPHDVLRYLAPPLLDSREAAKPWRARFNLQLLLGYSVDLIFELEPSPIESIARIAHRIGRRALMDDPPLFFLRVLASSREINRLPYPNEEIRGVRVLHSFPIHPWLKCS